MEVSWIFDACIEALGREEAIHFLETLKKDLEQKLFIILITEICN